MAAKVVILGGGLAGARVAAALHRLGRARPGLAQVELLDATCTYAHLPALPAVAAGLLPAELTTAPLARRLPGTALHRATVAAVDPSARLVRAERPDGVEYEIGYDHLVVCLGGSVNTPSTRGAADHALPLRTPADATAIRSALAANLASAKAERGLPERRALETVVIVGGGLAGVALAGSLADVARRSGAPLRVVLAERRPRLLASMPEGVGEAALAELEARSVDVRLRSGVAEVNADSVSFEDGSATGARACVWAAGTRGPQLVETSFVGAERTAGGRLVVNPMLAVRGLSNVWAAGDCAAVPYLDAAGDCPSQGTFARGQAWRLARNVHAVLGGDYPMSFRRVPAASIALVGARAGVGAVLGRPTRGHCAWLAWLASVPPPRPYPSQLLEAPRTDRSQKPDRPVPSSPLRVGRRPAPTR